MLQDFSIYLLVSIQNAFETCQDKLSEWLRTSKISIIVFKGLLDSLGFFISSLKRFKTFRNLFKTLPELFMISCILLKFVLNSSFLIWDPLKMTLTFSCKTAYNFHGAWRKYILAPFSAFISLFEISANFYFFFVYHS